MPAKGIIASFADKAGVSTDRVEHLWDKAKSIVKKQYEITKKDGERFYSLVVGILKKMLKIEGELENEKQLIEDLVKEASITTTSVGGAEAQHAKKIMPLQTRYGTYVPKKKKKKKKSTMESVRDYLNSEYICEAKKKVDYIRKFKKKVDEVNKYIEQAKKDDIWAIEPDSTWESPYIFEPVKLTKTQLVVTYWEDLYKKKKKTVDKVSFAQDKDNYPEFGDTKHMLSWIKRAIKKGYKEEGKSIK
jgi:hypothetical protein